MGNLYQLQLNFESHTAKVSCDYRNAFCVCYRAT